MLRDDDAGAVRPRPFVLAIERASRCLVPARGKALLSAGSGRSCCTPSRSSRSSGLTITSTRCCRSAALSTGLATGARDGATAARARRRSAASLRVGRDRGAGRDRRRSTSRAPGGTLLRLHAAGSATQGARRETLPAGSARRDRPLRTRRAVLHQPQGLGRGPDTSGRRSTKRARSARARATSSRSKTGACIATWNSTRG